MSSDPQKLSVTSRVPEVYINWKQWRVALKYPTANETPQMLSEYISFARII
jgi:hypothetical protein